MRIGDAARRSGVNAKTIRYYESIDLIRSADRRDNGYRDYDTNDVQELIFIQSARSLGFTIEDIRTLLSLWRDRDRASADVRALAERHLGEIDARITDLQAIRATLTGLITACHGDNRPECPILDGLGIRNDAERKA